MVPPTFCDIIMNTTKRAKKDPSKTARDICINTFTAISQAVLVGWGRYLVVESNCWSVGIESIFLGKIDYTSEMLSMRRDGCPC